MRFDVNVGVFDWFGFHGRLVFEVFGIGDFLACFYGSFFRAGVLVLASYALGGPVYLVSQILNSQDRGAAKRFLGYGWVQVVHDGIDVVCLVLDVNVPECTECCVAVLFGPFGGEGFYLGGGFECVYFVFLRYVVGEHYYLSAVGGLGVESFYCVSVVFVRFGVIDDDDRAVIRYRGRV